MGVSASLTDTCIRAVPGQESECPVYIRNTGPVVDQFTVDVLGASTDWATAEPAVLNLYPGDSGEVRIKFCPPKGPDVAAGEVPFGVRVVSREDPHGSWVGEGTVEVERLTDVRTALMPRKSRGARRGKHRLEVENQGNCPVATEVAATDPEDDLHFKVAPSTFVTAPGEITTVRVVAKPRRRIVRGPKETKKFQIMVVADNGDQVNSEGTYEQRPIVPAWVVPALAMLAVLVIVGAGLWFALLKPVVKSTAQQAAVQEQASVAANVEQVKQQASRAEEKAKQAAGGGGADGAGGATKPAGAGGAGGGAAAGAAGAGGGDPSLTKLTDFRIEANASPKKPGLQSFTFPGQQDKPLDITDVQLQNPNGDEGTLEIQRNGKAIARYGLANFRDYDYHQVVPYHFNKGDVLAIAVECRNPVENCKPAVTFAGRTLP